MYFGKAEVNSYDKGITKEWLIANCRGSYGFGTIIGANSRRQHGLLVCRASESRENVVLLSKLEEEVHFSGKRYRLTTNKYRDIIYPDGYKYLHEYMKTPFPTFLYVIHSVFLQKVIFMPYAQDSVVVKYKVLSAPSRIRLQVSPVFAHRTIRDVRRQKTEEFEQSFNKDLLNVKGYGFETYLRTLSADYEERPLWFEDIEYERNTEDGEDAFDKIWSSGYYAIDMAEGDCWYLVASSEPISEKFMDSISELEKAERERYSTGGRKYFNVPLIGELIKISDCFISDVGGEYTLLTGYPSVEEEARVVFASMPGILIYRGKEEVCLSIIDRWRRLAKDGILPSSVDPLDKKPQFEAVDSGLWLLYAMDKLITETANFMLVDRYWGDLTKVIKRYTEGIKELDLIMDKDDCLLYVRSSNPKRHWMNETVDGEPVVLRKGALVEVNALWYNALRFIERMTEFKEDNKVKEFVSETAEKVRKSFIEKFWYPEGGYLYDWIDGDEKDETLRPNQILAVSLPSSPLPPEMARSVVEVVWDNLYTTYGLRSLDPRHDKYKGRFEGRPDQKKKALFRGMAWPWLLAHFISAFLRYNPNKKDIAWCFIRPFLSHQREGCLGGIAKVFDGSMPYKPHGDVAYTLSIGEMLRVLFEDMVD